MSFFKRGCSAKETREKLLLLRRKEDTILT